MSHYLSVSFYAVQISKMYPFQGHGVVVLFPSKHFENHKHVSPSNVLPKFVLVLNMHKIVATGREARIQTNQNLV
jgi:hypothetical protein